ncbi:MAG TPA: cysteine desulfurase [Candidatus Nanoarchaeia archaeon]|nr:cysteine desulfurase [Candidatus Nanoarchaeia archaeon]
MLTNEKVTELRKDFPILKKKIANKPLVYLDNAASTQKPEQVIGALDTYYREDNANIHRGVYKLSEMATEKYNHARSTIAKFINAQFEEIIFTRNTTESINLLAYTLEGVGKKIVLTELEHHSNMVPWQQVAKHFGKKIEYIKVNKNFTLDYEDAEKKIDDETGILAIGHISNALGTINDVKKLVKLGKSHGAITIVDGAQSVPHMPVDVKEIGCDYLAFSGHKMLGPTGIGVLYGRKELLEKHRPFNYGGDMIQEVTYQGATWNKLPMKFEAGTPHIAGAIGLGAAVDYLQKIGMGNIHAWEKRLVKISLEGFKKIPGIAIYNPGQKDSSGIISFNLKDAHAHDVAQVLDDDNICIRGGHHCAMPLMSKLGIAGTSRASFYLYNTEQEIAILMKGLEKAQKVFG